MGVDDPPVMRNTGVIKLKDRGLRKEDFRASSYCSKNTPCSSTSNSNVVVCDAP